MFDFLRKGKKRQKFVIIMGAGRCGTTYVMDELNKIDGVNIFGENNMLFVDLLQMMGRLDVTVSKGLACKKHADLKYGKSSYTNTEWYNDVSGLRRIFRRLDACVTGYFSARHRVVGFKEIRFVSEADVKSLFFFEGRYEVFYIHLTRDIERQSKSAWWKDDPRARETIAGIDASIQGALCGRKGYLKVDLDEVRDDISKVRSFIGI
jgi:hypothetical protein